MSTAAQFVNGLWWSGVDVDCTLAAISLCPVVYVFSVLLGHTKWPRYMLPIVSDHHAHLQSLGLIHTVYATHNVC